MDNQPLVKKRRGISPVWTLPILAIGLCAWLLYKSFMEAGIEVVVYFADASGLTPEKTLVVSKGIPLGIVKTMTPDIENNRVKVMIEMDRETEPFLVEDAKFWIVRPEVSASRIVGLETILSGSYIRVQRGESTVESRVFTALSSAPPVPSDTPGLHIKLRSTTLRSIQVGSAIYFRNIEIGSVQTYRLDEDNTILINCFIQPKYSHLVKSGSRFYDASGLTLTGKFPNLKLRMESVASLFTGGIVVGTPEALEDTPLAINGDSFTLFEDFEAANYGIPMTLKLASGTGISETTTKVMYRGLEAGYVKKITFNGDARHTVTAHILLDPRADIILRENTRFWLVKPQISIDGIQNLDTLLSGPYITFQLGDGDFRDEFQILHSPPEEPPLRPGKSFILSSAKSPASAIGSPLYFKNIKIGEIIGKRLSEDRNSTETTVFIYDEYTDIIFSDTVFIEAEGISIDADLSGFSINVGSLVTTIKGGISVVNLPASKRPASPHSAEEGSRYKLHRDLKSALVAVPSLKPEGLYLTLVADNLDSYKAGSPILFKKIRVGQVIGFEYSEKEKKVHVNCFIEKQYQDLVTSTSRFYRASGIRIQGGASGISVETESLASILVGGIGFMTPAGGKPAGGKARFTIYDSLDAARTSDNVEISVRFKIAEQLKLGAEVTYRGIQLGTVDSITFGEKLESVIATLSIQKPYETFFRETTRIWVTTPSIGFNEVRNLDNVIFGSSIKLKPGTGEITHDFVGFESAPYPLSASSDGLGIVLQTAHLGSLDHGSPVYYRQVKVGQVTGYSLASDFKNVLIYASINEKYAPIIRENTRFWNASGVTVKGGLFSGITVTTQSVTSLIAGGISLATPGKEEMGSTVKEGFLFTLHDEPEEGWLDWSPDIFSVSEESGSIPR
jgi:paraquat-inducible protein B